MRITDRIGDVTERLEMRRLETKTDKLDRENDRLRGELRLTREELAAERDSRGEFLNTIKSMPKATTKVKVKKKPGLLRLAVVGGGAYVLGTRAGRERYDQLKSWASDARNRVQGGSNGDEAEAWHAATNGVSTPASTPSVSPSSSASSGSTKPSSTKSSSTSGTSSTSR